jgi:hypothetical protein
MGMGASLVMIAAGAILAFAVHTSASGFSIHTVGIILLVVGVAGVVLSAVFWSSWGGFGGARNTTTVAGRNTTTVVDR